MIPELARHGLNAEPLCHQSTFGISVWIQYSARSFLLLRCSCSPTGSDLVGKKISDCRVLEVVERFPYETFFCAAV